MGIIPYIGIVISLVMLCYGGYMLATAPTDNFWSGLATNLLGIVTFWVWIPVLLGCCAWIYMKREEKKWDEEWDKKFARFGGPSWGI